MQPPPQTVPPGSGAPPMGMPPSTYWRNSPFSKRTNVPMPGGAASVQPVTDPFAFGKKAAQSVPLNPSKGNPLVPPGPSIHQSSIVRSHAGDYSQGVHISQPGAATQQGAHTNTYSNVLAPLASPAHSTVTSSVTDPAHHDPSGHLHYSMGHPNAIGAHLQGGVFIQNPPQGSQDLTRDLKDSSAVAPTTSSLFSQPSSQETMQWMPIHGGSQPSAQNYLPFAGPSFLNANYGGHHTSSSLYTSSSPVPVQAHIPWVQTQHQPIQQHTTAASLLVGSNENRLNVSQSNNNPSQPANMFHHNPGLSNSWFSQPHQEQCHPQPYLSEPNLPHPVPLIENAPQGGSEATGDQVLADTDAGTVSMFFKADEAENKEILSLDLHADSRKSGLDSHEQNPGLVHPPTGDAHKASANVLLQTPVSINSTSESTQKGTEVQQYFPQTKSNQHDAQVVRSFDYSIGDKAVIGTHSRAGPQYDNVENIECIQNLEVFPSESLKISVISSSTNPDLLRYGLSGQSLSQSSMASHAEGGPNLESPDSVPNPIRSDSVSSNYSSVSHRSASSSTRPQGVAGTFIQQESGKLDEDFSTGFFKQIDSSPLGTDPCEQNSTKNSYQSTMSQPPTPSPPKPTGIFQTSANSSFEPVRSHGVGVKPAEVDQAKMVEEVRGNHMTQKNTQANSDVPAASPGNLEQPPDNLETIFLPQVHPFGHTAIGDPGNFLKPVKGPSTENVSTLLNKRPSSRAHGANKKCESPATTLWAQNELPDFGGNVLLAPAAPPVLVTPKPQTAEVIQPPEDGVLGQMSNKTDSVLVLSSPDGHVSSENLENPPKMGEEEPLHSQASSGYASLLSSPPTETSQNPPVLITQPNQSYSLAQPVNFSHSLPNQLNLNQNNQSLKDPGVTERPVPVSLDPQGSNTSRESDHLSIMSVGCKPPLLSTNVPNANAASNNAPCPETAFSSTANLLIQPMPHQLPLNLVTENQKNKNFLSEFSGKAMAPGMDPSTDNAGIMLVPPLNTTLLNKCSASHSMGQEETGGALDFTTNRASTNQSGGTSFKQGFKQLHAGSLVFPQQTHAQISQVGAEMRDKPFYRQVTKDAEQQAESKKGQEDSQGSQKQMTLASQLPTTTQPPGPSAYQKNPGSVLAPATQRLGTPMPGAFQVLLPSAQPAQPSGEQTSSSSGPAVSVSSSQPVMQQEEQRPPPSQAAQQAPGPQVDPSTYYYYRHPYGAYVPSYPQSYPQSDPRAAQLYYQEDAYSTYDPRYQYYNSSAAYADPGKYRYNEQERPSSRSSQCSDRPPSRQEYLDYSNPKSGWSSHSDYYADYYYPNQYDYGDPTRWDHYPAAYDPRYRDHRSYDRRYWYETDHDAYQRLYTTRRDGYDSHWQYDPRFAGSFDDDSEPHRDPYGDECDRRSIHSEHSAHSLHSSHSVHSRRSSFSSRSQQSQVYKGQQDLTANAYGAAVRIPSLHADYSYGLYPGNFDNQQTDANYQYGYPAESGWQSVDQVPSRPLTPEKFSVPHVCARFGPGGYFIKILPNLPSEGQPALVEIHSMETMLQNIPEQEEMRTFPGPLTKDETHKVDVINFAQNKATACFRNENLIDKESSSLLWELIMLLCRQNGTIVGTDIAELLLRDHKTVWLPGKSPNEANLIDFNNEAVEQVEEEPGASQLSFLTDTTNDTASDEKEIERFRELLLYGRKKDALESAMKHGLWGHALLLASKMDSRTHARVMTRFANSLPINDPLQTVYQLMSGRMPAASTCCGDEKWGDWRPHLAMVLSNLTNNMDVESRTMVTMGDTLISKGLLEAAHFCYLMAQIGFGVYTKKTTKLVLIGANHSLPFQKFASNEAIQRTEAYEYAQSLGTQPCSLPNFQVFKFMYACRLAEMGLAAQAFHYCEVISKTVIKHPSYYSPVLISQLVQVASQMRFFDPQLKEKPEEELFIQPDWLLHLQHLDGQIKQGTIVYNSDRATPQQYACSTPSSEVDHISQCDSTGAAQEVSFATDNPLMAALIPNTVQPLQGIQLALPDPQPILGAPHPGLQDTYPMAPPLSVVPGPSLGAPVPNAGSAVPYSTEPMHAYSGSAAPPVSPSTKSNECVPEQHWSPEPVLQRRISQESPTKKTFHDQGTDFYEMMSKMAPAPRSRTTSQSSAHMGYGRRSRTTSESSSHSVGSGRRNSAAKQPSPPPPPIPEVPRSTGHVSSKEPKASTSHGKNSRSWFPLKISWLMGKGKNEAHLPDDTNRSIVWDEKKQRWVNLDEPEEENKPLPPPPPGMLKSPQIAPAGPGAPPNSSVNMFSIRAAGSRGRYVDVLNPVGNRSNSSVPLPSDLFAPLAPMPIPTNLFVPSAVPDDAQPAEGSDAKQTLVAEQSGTEPSTESQLSRSSSMSSLSREVSQHFPQAPTNATPPGGPHTGTVPFYNPSQFAQPSGTAGASRTGRFGQRKYPSLK